MRDEAPELYDAIRKVHVRHANAATISPAWLATEAMVLIGFPRELHPIGYIGCHLEMRQIARQFLRGTHDPVEIGNPLTGSDLFPDTLQARYPRRGGDNAEPEYIRRELMSVDDYEYNIERIRKASGALARHGDALEADKRRKFGRAA